MPDITINFYGGTQQVNPSATTAVQNFYGDQFAKEKLKEEAMSQLNLSPEALKFSTYINKVEDVPRYLSLLSPCESATELAQVVMAILEAETKVTEEEVVRRRFIECILPLCPKMAANERGNSIDNIRARINDALAKRPKKRPMASK
ncbi:MAG: hypothetical protein ACI378_06390 [Bacteroides sp.]